MDKKELEQRTKRFAVDVIRFVSDFERSAPGRVIANQLVKSATSVGANYREANRSLSRREFTHKITLVEKEASETEYWLEICIDASTGGRQTAITLLAECRELVAIFTSIGRSMRAAGRQSQPARDDRTSEPDSADYGASASKVDIDDVATLIPAFDSD
jgi:four helix bundle protein